MNKEMKLLAKKLTALFLSLVLVIGLVPGNARVEAATNYSVELLDYVDTYYNGFNDDVFVATGTFIALDCGGDTNYITVDKAVKKDSSYKESVSINYSDEGEMEIAYEEGDVYLKVIFEGEEVYKEKLYTPNYVEVSEMPVIALHQEVEVAGTTEKYCEQYYRVDTSEMSASSKYKAYTIALEDEDGDSCDTYMFLYDETGKQLAENDDENDNTYTSAITFGIPESGEIIVGVREIEYDYMLNVSLKLVGGAKSIVSFGSDNAEELNVFYEGFNDDIIYATGTRIKAELDNGAECQWQAEGWYWDDMDDEKDGVNISLGDVDATIYRGTDGAVYADYGLSYGTSTTTAKLFTPVIKPVSDLQEIEEGTVTINTLPYEGAYNYYRLTAEDRDETWNLSIACTGDPEEYSEMYVDVYEQDRTLIGEYEQGYNDETFEMENINLEVIVPAGSTIIIGVYDFDNTSQEFSMTATKETDENPTTEDPTTEPPTTEAPTTEAPTTTVAPTTVAPTTTVNAQQQKLNEFKKAGKAKIKAATKKKSAKKVKISLKKTIKSADGYQVRIYKTKKNAKKNKKAVVKIKVKKNKKKFTVKSKKLANKKTLYVRVRAYVKVSGKTYTGKWSKVKKIKIK